MTKFASAPLTVATMDGRIYEALRDEIVHELAPGTPLRLVELAAHFHVSVMPVRAAIARLASEGLVHQRPHRGAVVAPLMLDDLEEVQALRTGIEGYAAARAAAIVTEPTLARMRKLLERLTVAAAANDLDRYLALQAEFHDVCYAGLGRPRLLELVATHRRAAERYIRVALSESSGLAGSIEHQRRFLAACSERDGERAAREVREAFAWTVGQIRTYLDMHPEASTPHLRASRRHPA